VAANPKIIGFFSGERPDSEGRYLRDIQKWPDGPLESIHDFIQWMFPLAEPSPVNPDAPVLDADTISAIRTNSVLQRALRASWLRMLDFYGLEVRDQGVECAHSFAIKSQNWLRPGNHNHLRITRILKCLRLLGLEQEALAFFACLRSIYELERAQTRPGITERTFRFWEEAAGAPRNT
jgi:hypothetical protein